MLYINNIMLYIYNMMVFKVF